jgi:hypothetical protein
MLLSPSKVAVKIEVWVWMGWVLFMSMILVAFQISQGVNFPNQYLPTRVPFPLLEEIFMKGFECHDQDSINISRMSRKRHS